MKNFLRRLRSGKGFTLVECIIALAVFAIMTVMVLMVLGMAQTTSKRATEAEADLNNLVQNVVGDDSEKKFNEGNSRTLNMTFDTGSSSYGYAVSYNTIDGNKNWVYCPNYFIDSDSDGKMDCDMRGDNSLFMLDASGNELSYDDFALTSLEYTCPKCGLKFYQKLKCEACETEAYNNDTSVFKFDKSTGGYYHVYPCGSSSVKGANVDMASTADSDFSVSGITPNAIKYGKVTPYCTQQPGESNADFEQRVKDSMVTIYNPSTFGTTVDEEDRLSMQIFYLPGDDTAKPGEYTIELSSLKHNGASLPSGETRNVQIKIPGGYVAEITYVSPGITAAFQGNTQGQGIKDFTKYGTLNVAGFGAGTAQIKFKLTNYKSNFSFDYDYQTDNGLIGYWFNVNAAAIQTVPYTHPNGTTVTRILTNLLSGYGNPKLSATVPVI